MMEKKENLMKLDEATRQQLISKSKSGASYSPKNQARGKNRWERRRYSTVANSVAEYNKINMDDFFKKDLLRFSVKVNGETDVYFVTIGLFNLLREIQNQIKINKNKLEFKTILIALTRLFNNDDVYVSCTCPDFKYRFAYVANQDGYDSSPFPELRPANITNPTDDKGAACKHVNLVLSNVDWIYKVSSVINNYINYCKDNMENNYARYIFPQLFGMPYDKAIQMSVFDYDENGNVIPNMDSSEEVINLANAIGKRRGVFRAGNPYRFQPKHKPQPEDENPLDLKVPNGPQRQIKGLEDDEETNPEEIK